MTKKISSEVPHNVRIITAEGEVIDDGFSVVNVEHDERISYDAQNAATEAEGWLQAHNPANGCVRYVGQQARTAIALKQARKFWNSVLRQATLGYVTLDTDPEYRGRPESYRPGIPAVFAVSTEMAPDSDGQVRYWGDGGAEVALLYCVPSGTWLADDPTPYDPQHKTEKASFGGGSVVAVLAFRHWDLDEVEAWQEEGRAAVRAIAGAAAAEAIVREDEGDAYARMIAAARM